MLDDPRSRTFTNSFIGQWLGTQEIGGRFMPLLTEMHLFYNAGIAADLQDAAGAAFDRIVGENRSLLELLNSDYTYLTRRLATYYQMEDQVKDVADDELPSGEACRTIAAQGLLGMAGVLGMTSHYEQTSPVLRGAWVLDTLLGTPVPPPPPDVPPLDTSKVRGEALDARARPAASRRSRVFRLPQADGPHRLRPGELRLDGPLARPRDATASRLMPPANCPRARSSTASLELRDVLLQHKDDFVRQVTAQDARLRAWAAVCRTAIAAPCSASSTLSRATATAPAR